MITIGIDPGLTGAIAILSPHEALVYDMPTVPFGKTGFIKRAVDLPALEKILFTYVDFSPRVFLEKVSARPGQGVASMFSLGMSFWGAAGVAAGLDIPLSLVMPQTWKAHFGLTAEKETSLTLARTLYPGVNLKLKKHHGQAEALLIARYGQEMTKWNSQTNNVSGSKLQAGR